MNARPGRAATPERLFWTAAIVVGASLPHWPRMPLWAPVLLVVCTAWRLAAATLRWPLPNTALRLVLALLAFLGVLMEFRTINGLTAGSALLVVMMALKFLESHTQRDQLVLMILAYFLVFAGLLYPQHSLLAGAYLLGFVWVTTVALLQLGRRGPLLATQRSARLAARLLLQSVPIMIVLFLFFPRLPGPLWALPGSAGTATSGLSDTMSPGDITALGLSDEVAFRVEFFGKTPPADELYWRGPVLSSFDGRTWSRRRGLRRRVRDTVRYIGGKTRYRVMLEPSGTRWAFALDMPQRWSGAQRIWMNSDYQLGFFGYGPRDITDYTVTSYTHYQAREPLSPAEQAYYRRLPPGNNPRTRAMVAKWLADDPSPAEIVKRALNVFRDARFYYTLTPPPLGADAVDDFLFKTREGFCEHYASAFAVMMRAAGVPARVVTGYQGGELNSFGRYYIIRQSDAHAWTEVWLPGQGWVRIDPTAIVAPARIATGSSRDALSGAARPGNGFTDLPWIRTAMLAWDAADTYWNSWVLGYGPELQRQLLRSFGLRRPDRLHLLLLSLLSTGAVVIGLAVYLGWRSRERGKPDPAARCFARFAKKLSRAKVPPRRPGEGPAAYAVRARALLPKAAPQIAAILRSYLAARYEPDPHGRQLARLRGLVKDFRPRRVL